MLKIRLRRMGNRNRPFYRIVVSDSRRAPSSSAVEEIGFYDPAKGPDEFRVDVERVDHWTAAGAQLSPTVKRLVRRQRRSAA